MRRLLALTLLVLPVSAGTAAAQGPPIMPLSQVHAGMHCTAHTVIQGTTITTFDADVIDVVTNGQSNPASDLILFRASGPAVAGSGIAEGMSGSPITCPDGGGVQRIIGAVSYGTGDYGGNLALATPIQSVLQTPVDPPASPRVDRALLRHKRPLGTPLTITGLAPPIAKALQAGAAERGRVVYAAPARPRGLMLPQALQPGSSMTTMLSDGDIAAGAIGTVSYTDGDKVWGFGHPLEGAGARSLILGDAYVYAVVGTPLDGAAGVSYKLAAPVNNLGTLTADGPYGVAGKVGVAPGLIPVTVVAHDADRGTHSTVRTNVADERALGYPAGYAALSLVAPAAAAQASYSALDGNPSAQTGTMCLTVTLQGRTEPIHFCNRYVGAFGGASGIGVSPLVADVAQATGDIGSYQFGLPAITKVRITMTLRRGMRQAYLTRVQAPRVVRRGHTARLRITTRSILDGKVATEAVRVRIPATASRGVRTLSLQGTPADASPGGGDGETFTLADLFDFDTGSSTGPHTVDGLAKQIEEIHRVEGVALRLQPRKLAESLKGVTDAEELQALLAAQKSQTTDFPAHILRSRTLRISGSASTTVVVR